MKHILRVFTATAAFMLLSSTVFGIVTVETFTQEIMDIGSKTGYGEAADSAIQAFDDGIGAHEVVGTLRFSAHEGQVGGLSQAILPWAPDALCSGLMGSRQSKFDSGDWDIPDRIFGCQDLSVLQDGSGCWTGAITDIVSFNNMNSDGFFDSMLECDIAPDQTGRLDSASCSNIYADNTYVVRNAAATYACAVPISRQLEYTFFNYMGCYPDINCFQPDPALDATGCDEGVTGAFDLDGANPADVWVSGTVLQIRLPLGTRIGNTVYPGTMLNGAGQFGYDNVNSARRGNNGVWGVPGMAFPALAWPAVVFDFEANHRIGVNCTPSEPNTFNITWSPRLCQANDQQYDKISVFVPDILDSLSTTAGNLAVFQIGEALIDQAGMLPASRDLVSNCYRDGDGVGACLSGIPVPGDPCDYDTRICVDIRGAYPSLRAGDPNILRRYVFFNPQLPQDSPTDLDPPNNWQVAVLKARTMGSVPTWSYTYESFPSCDGYNFCYLLTDPQNPNGGTVYPDPLLANPPRFLYVPFSSTGSVTITEPNSGFIRVESTILTALRSTMTCELATDDSQGNNVQDGVDFVYADLQGTSTTVNGECPRIYMPYEVASIIPGAGLHSPPQTTVTVTGGGGTMSGFFPSDGGVLPNDLMTIPGDLGGSDQITWQIASESSGATPGSLTLHGFELLISDEAAALPANGTGCIELDCYLRFPGEECQLHEGVANDDTGGDNHLPSGAGNYGPPTFFNNLPIACIVPGRTVLLYPYMIKALGYDTGIVVTNTAGSNAIVHFYLYQEEGPLTAGKIGTGNVGTNPVVSILKAQDPEFLSKLNSPCLVPLGATTGCTQTYYDAYNEIPAFGQYVNMVFALEDDPLVPKNDWSKAQGLDPSTGIFSSSVLHSLTSDPDGNAATDDGRVWMYAVVQQCYSHGYHMVFSDGGFGSTLALVDNDTTIRPVDDNNLVVPRASATRFTPFHMPPSRFINPGGALPDVETWRYRFWNGNDE